MFLKEVKNYIWQCFGCSHFEMKAGNKRELLHGELLGALLVVVTLATFDLGRAAQVLRPCESTTNTQQQHLAHSDQGQVFLS